MRIEAQLLTRLRRSGLQHGVGLQLLLLSGWAALLGRRFGKQELAVSIGGLRQRIAPVCICLQQDEPIGAWLARTRESLVTQGVAVPDLLQMEVAVGTVAFATELSRIESSLAVDNRGATIGMSLSLADSDGGVTAEFACSRAPSGMAEQIAMAWLEVLQAIADDAAQPLWQLPMLAAQERRQLLCDRNATARPVAFELIHEMFERQAADAPHAIAVEYGDEALSYADLNRRANQLARHLQDLGVRPADRVGVFVARGLDLAVALFAVLKAGAVYLPLDPAYPRERLARIIDDAKPRAILTQRHLLESLTVAKDTLVVLESCHHEIAARDGNNLDSVALGLTASHCAYVIYTSGSTGLPKGVVAQHRGMVNRIVSQALIDPFLAGERCCHKTSVGFVDSIFELLGPLSHGLPVTIASAAQIKDVQQLQTLVERKAITRLVTVPSLAGSLLESQQAAQRLASVRHWTLSGEELNPTLLAKLQGQLPGCTFVNLYGSSEVAADATYYICGGTAYTRVPIGSPLANTRIYILDQYLQPVPVATVGEIYVAGAGVALGYHGQPGLTAERFLADPFVPDPSARMFKSGDLGAWRAEGGIDYFGRNDHQVKLRGYRIELGEIETQLLSHSAVTAAAVVAREAAGGGEQLVAYVSAREQSLQAEALAAHLKRVLPEYMIPSAFVVLDRLPLTASGKVDRRALPAPQREAFARRPYEAPQGRSETVLASVWQELLGLDRVGRNDHFLELGGHSLLAVTLAGRLRAEAMMIQVAQILQHPVLAEMARVASQIEPEGASSQSNAMIEEPTIGLASSLAEFSARQIRQLESSVPGAKGNIQAAYPLTPLQEGMLFHHLRDEHSSSYVDATLLSLSSRDRVDALLEALQTSMDRHDVLRSAVLWEQLPQPVLVIFRRTMLPVAELTLAQDGDAEDQVRQWLQPQQLRMDLSRAPLLSVTIASDRAAGWYVLVKMHHIIQDDVSIRMLLSEIHAFLNHRSTELAAAVPYRHHVAHSMARMQRDDGSKFFRAKLSDIDEATAPFGLLEGPGGVLEFAEARRSLESQFAQRLINRARYLGVNVASLFHAAWALTLACTTGREDVVFGTVLLGRMSGDPEASGAFGMMVNTLPIRLPLTGLSAYQLVRQAHSELTDLLDYEHVSLAAAQRHSALGAASALFSSVLNYRRSETDLSSDFARVTGGRVLGRVDRAHYPITVSIDDVAGQFSFTLQTDRRIDPARLIDYLHTATDSLLLALEHAPDTHVLALSVLPEGERHQVIELFNSRQRVFPQDKPLHALFEEQVERTPQGIAVVHDGRSLTYDALNRRANQLARHLVTIGVGVDELVGICVERSLDMVIGLLGILKAGGAYVPLDPNYPPERLAYMLEDAAPRVVVTHSMVRAQLPETSAEIVDLDVLSERLQAQSVQNISPALGQPHHLTYVIYTSGSTGKPKGVMIEHRHVTRLFTATQHLFSFGEQDVWTMFHSYAFDFSVWELWGALLHGGRLVVVPLATARSTQDFYRLLCDERVTVLNQTPSAFRQLIQADAPSQQHSLRTVIFGGEALELHTLQPWVERHGVDRPQLVNMYGITETTVHVTHRRLSRHEIESDRSSVIGHQILDLRLYILNSQRQPVPVGVPGELYVGGAGVARGYLNRPELSAARFLRDPFSSEQGARMYKTGDIGRWRPDGTVEYLGRNDSQVKIRGFRIELGEIQARIAQHAQVKDSVVVACDLASGEKQLIAYVTIDGDVAPAADELRTFVAATLPAHMVPSGFVVLERFPLTANGKLDRHALPIPDLSAHGAHAYQAPHGEVEQALADMWCEVLHVQRVGRNDNFFELGGHSLLGTLVIGRLRSALGVETPMRLVFEYPVLKQLAEQLEALLDADLLEDIERGGDYIEGLLETLAALPEGALTDFERDLKVQGRS